MLLDDDASMAAIRRASLTGSERARHDAGNGSRIEKVVYPCQHVVMGTVRKSARSHDGYGS
jgi:hypothetical protein